MKIIILICAAVLTGCAVPTTGVVPKGNGLHTVARQGAGAWVSTDSLKAAATQEAQAFCLQTGKTVQVIHTKEIQAGPLGRWPESEVLFSCN
jgi:hypothetical protein